MFELDDFQIKINQLDKGRMRFCESIMSLGNEYMGMRGNFEERYSDDSMQGTYIGGVWYPDQTRVGWWKNGYPNYFGKVINAPNFIGIDVVIDGDILDLSVDKVDNFSWNLDMKNGVLNRSFEVSKVFDGKVSRYFINVSRFLSIDTKEICAVKYQVTPLDADSKVEFLPYIDADVKNEDSNYEEKFWNVLEKDTSVDSGYIVAKTKENKFGVEQFTICDYMKSRCYVGDNVDKEFASKDSISESCSFDEYKRVVNSVCATVSKGDTITLEKIVSVKTSRDVDEDELVNEAKKVLDRAFGDGFDKLLENHSNLWLERWEKADVEIKNNTKLQQGIRYNIFQLFSTFYGQDQRLNVGPKGYTGEKYGGATYWDTEAYIIPMYLSITPKSVTENLLKYRFNQLDNAYHNAIQQGLDGALYPMVTFNGIECHNEWEITFEEIHRNGAIAYAIYNYTNYTGDFSYLKDYGIKVLVGISKFWADRVHFSKNKNKYMIHGVTGPNEYDNNVNNNWYTNKIAIWTLRYTIEMINKIESMIEVNSKNIVSNKIDVEVIKECDSTKIDEKGTKECDSTKIDEKGTKECDSTKIDEKDIKECGSSVESIYCFRDSLNISSKELERWQDIIDNMYLPYDAEREIFVQHDTFLDKDLMPVDELDKSQRPLNQNWSWDKILRSCFIKQADVLQGLYFFNDEFDLETKKRNFEFYEPMTVHESSLSACIHSILACEIGLKNKAEEMFERTARLDLDNYNNDTDDGLHITSMSGGWLSVVQGFGGMRTFNEELRFNPILPDNWDGYSFKINYRDRLIKVDVDKDEVKISLERGREIEIGLYNEKVLLKDVVEKPVR